MLARGFTLVELLVVLAISAILATISIPAFESAIASMRASEAANSMVAALELARSEAMRRGQVITVCRLADSTAATASLGCSSADVGGYAGNDWANGWMTFVDGGTRGAVNTGDEPVRVQQLFAGASRPSITLAAASPARAVEGVSFQPTGLRVPDSGPASFQVQVPATGAVLQRRCIAVNATGQIAVTRGVCP